jgi:hypothetical protein
VKSNSYTFCLRRYVLRLFDANNNAVDGFDMTKKEIYRIPLLDATLSSHLMNPLLLKLDSDRS